MNWKGSAREFSAKRNVKKSSSFSSFSVALSLHLQMLEEFGYQSHCVLFAKTLSVPFLTLSLVSAGGVNLVQELFLDAYRRFEKGRERKVKERKEIDLQRSRGVIGVIPSQNRPPGVLPYQLEFVHFGGICVDHDVDERSLGVCPLVVWGP